MNMKKLTITLAIIGLLGVSKITPMQSSLETYQDYACKWPQHLHSLLICQQFKSITTLETLQKEQYLSDASKVIEGLKGLLQEIAHLDSKDDTLKLYSYIAQTRRELDNEPLSVQLGYVVELVDNIIPQALHNPDALIEPQEEYSKRDRPSDTPEACPDHPEDNTLSQSDKSSPRKAPRRHVCSQYTLPSNRSFMSITDGDSPENTLLSPSKLSLSDEEDVNKWLKKDGSVVVSHKRFM